jgi:DNA-binding HxlR family transcriptional regulator/putative sterol carrier protein
MRSYEQFCGLAKALDVVGDRWTLLIVRELLLRGPSRYTDLQHGLPGIATNLLADRLRGLETSGVVAREEPTPPVATALFTLTEWGEQLRPIVQGLGLWAGRLMAKPMAGDRFRSQWLTMPLETLLTDRAPLKPPIRIELRTGDQAMVVETAEGRIRVRPASKERPDAVLTGSPDVIIGLLTGRIDLATARSRRLRFEGDPAVLQRVRPIGPSRHDNRALK